MAAITEFVLLMHSLCHSTASSRIHQPLRPSSCSQMGCGIRGAAGRLGPRKKETDVMHGDAVVMLHVMLYDMCDAAISFSAILQQSTDGSALIALLSFSCKMILRGFSRLFFEIS